MTLPEHLLCVLGESAQPIPTPDLIAVCATDLTHCRSRVHAALRKLYAAGMVRKTEGRALPDGKPHRWYKHKGVPFVAWSIA